MAFEGSSFFTTIRRYSDDLFARYSWLRIGLSAFTLAIITCIAYAPTFWAPFIFDDNPVIVRFVQSYKTYDVSHLLWSSGRWVCYFLNVSISRLVGVNLIAFRSLALLIHLAIGLFLFLTFKRACEHYKAGSLLYRRSLLFSGIIATLYLLHPAHSQTVGYITQMELEGTALLSIVLSFYFITLYATAKGWWGKIGSATALVALMFFATGTKEIIIVLPVLALLFDWFFLAQASFKKIVSRAFLYVVMSFALVVMFKQGAHGVTVKQAVTGSFEVASNRGNQLAGYGNKITAYRYAITQWRVIMHYLRIYFLPYSMSFDYDFTLASSPFEPAIFMSFLFLVTLLCLSVLAFIKNRLSIFSFGVWWFFIALAPRSTFIPAWELAADYKAFLPGIGIIIFFAYGALYLYEEAHTVVFMRKVAHYTGLTVVLLFSFRVWEESMLRTNLANFWQNSVYHAPKKSRLWNNYGAALMEEKRIAEGLAAWETAVALDDHYAEPLVNLGIYYQGIRNREKAWEAYNKALPMLDEPHFTMYNNVGTLYLEEKKYAQAERAFRIALHLKGDYIEAHANLGFIYADIGRHEVAVNEFYHAMKLGCSATAVKYRCAESLLLCGREKEANELFAPGKSVSSAFFAAMGQQLYGAKQYERALTYFKHCSAREPHDLLFIYNKGLCFLALEKWNGAAECFKEVVNDERFPFSQLHYVKSLAAGGKQSEASRLAQKIMATATISAGVKTELHAVAQQFKLSL